MVILLSHRAIPPLSEGVPPLAVLVSDLPPDLCSSAQSLGGVHHPLYEVGARPTVMHDLDHHRGSTAIRLLMVEMVSRPSFSA